MRGASLRWLAAGLFALPWCGGGVWAQSAPVDPEIAVSRELSVSVAPPLVSVVAVSREVTITLGAPAASIAGVSREVTVSLGALAASIAGVSREVSFTLAPPSSDAGIAVSREVALVWNCFVAPGTQDCNGNGLADLCDIASGASSDGDADGIPDECQEPLIDYVRGDANESGGVLDIADPIAIWEYLIGAQPAGNCLEAYDANLDFAIDLADPVHLISYLFVGGPPPAAPFPSCGLPSQFSPLPCDAHMSCP